MTHARNPVFAGKPEVYFVFRSCLPQLLSLAGFAEALPPYNLLMPKPKLPLQIHFPYFILPGG
jgi:hypothetical protein